MSADALTAMAANYRNVARMFGTEGDIDAMIAHADAAELLDQAGAAVRDAGRSGAIAGWTRADGAELPDLIGVYQPRSRTIAVMSRDDLVTFNADEAEALRDALDDALRAAATGRSLLETMEGGR